MYYESIVSYKHWKVLYYYGASIPSKKRTANRADHGSAVQGLRGAAPDVGQGAQYQSGRCDRASAGYRVCQLPKAQRFADRRRGAPRKKAPIATRSFLYLTLLTYQLFMHQIVRFDTVAAPGAGDVKWNEVAKT